MTRVVCLTWAFVNVIFKTIVENPLINNFVNHNAHMFVSNPFQQINRFETNILTAYPFKPADNTIPIIVAFVDALTSKIGLKWTQRILVCSFKAKRYQRHLVKFFWLISCPYLDSSHLFQQYGYVLVSHLAMTVWFGCYSLINPPRSVVIWNKCRL